MMAVLQIENWNHVLPVMLPFETSSSMTSIMSSSLGILIPAIIFILFMFQFLHSLWMLNVAHISPYFKTVQSDNTEFSLRNP
jgi:hypothetical protein